MMKELSIWAIRLNTDLVELRVASGPIKIRTSKVTRVVKVKEEDPWYGRGRSRTVSKTIVMQHSHLIGGRTLGISRISKINGVGVFFTKDEFTKLTPAQAKTVMNPVWRKKNL